jgi:hypothetical protein
MLKNSKMCSPPKKRMFALSVLCNFAPIPVFSIHMIQRQSQSNTTETLLLHHVHCI